MKVARWRDLVRRDAWRELPPDIYIALTRQLFGISRSITAMEAALVAAIAGIAAWRTGDWLLAGTAVTTSSLVLLMIPVTRHYLAVMQQSDDLDRLRRMESRFKVHVWVVSAGIGLMAAYAMLVIADERVHLLLLLLTLGAMITNIRDHSRPLMPLGKTICLAAPVAIAGLASGDSTYQALGLCTVVAGKLIIDICKELYANTLAFQVALKEQERLMHELAAKNLDLEARESQRVEQEAELKRLQADLVQVSRVSAMGTMASTMAHELNQPLTAVANFARGSRRLLQDPTPQKIEKAVQGMAQVEAGAIRAGQIVRRIRGLVHRGDAQTRPERLRDIIAEAADMAFVDAHLMGVERNVNLPPPEMWVEADSIQVQQVLINLIRNAIEAVQKVPGARVTVSAMHSQELVTIEVADNGRGIQKDVRDDLFSPFNTTKTHGLGLGLSISRTIVEAHGGKIWSENRQSGGASFRFTLHRAKAVDEPQARRIVGRRGS